MASDSPGSGLDFITFISTTALSTVTIGHIAMRCDVEPGMAGIVVLDGIVAAAGIVVLDGIVAVGIVAPVGSAASLAGDHQAHFVLV